MEISKQQINGGPDAKYDMYYNYLKQTYQDDTYAKNVNDSHLEPMFESTERLIKKLEDRVFELEKFIGFKSDGFQNQKCKCGAIATRCKDSIFECDPPAKIYTCDKYPKCHTEKPDELPGDVFALRNFNQKVDKRNGVTVVLFYAPTDSTCQDIMGDNDTAVWTTIKKMHETHYAILIMEIDDSYDNKKIREKYDVQDYPTIVKIINGCHKIFDGEFSVNNIERFITSFSM